MIRDDDLIDEIAQTESDIFTKRFCRCLHELHPNGKCYAINSNGAVLSACICENSQPLRFTIEIPIYIGEDKKLCKRQ